MQIHELQPIHKNKNRKRVGRGGKRGTYSGRGQKGQSSRAGRKFQPAIREFIKRYPKLRGYRFGTGKKENIAVLQLSLLVDNFGEKEIINPKNLMEKGIISRTKNQIPQVKILGKAEVKKALIIEECLVSKGVKDIVEKAGGQIVTSGAQKIKDTKIQAKEKEIARKNERKIKAAAKIQAKEKSLSGEKSKAKSGNKPQKTQKSAIKKKTQAKPKAKK